MFAHQFNVNQNEYMIDTDQQPQPYSVRLPISIRRQLEESARASGRSLHAEILLRLGESLDASKDGNSAAQDDLEEKIRAIALEVVRAELCKTG